jgi:hypothetical protein
MRFAHLKTHHGFERMQLRGRWLPIDSFVGWLHGYLNAKGYIARGGQIIDTTIVSAPPQHNTREENEAIKAGPDAGGLGKKASQECAEGQRRAMDQEERPKLLRLQEPHQRRPQAQADPPLHRDGCLGA